MAVKGGTLAESVKARLSVGEWKAVSRTRWFDRLTSLWAPITLFGIVFGVYLCTVEFSVCLYPPLQPILQGFGVIMLAYYFGLVAMRVVSRGAMNARKTRGVAEELVAEVESLFDKNRAAVTGKPLEELLDAVASVMKDIGTRNADAMRTDIGKLSDIADKHLKKYRSSSPADFVGGFVKALFVALLIRTVLIEPFKIPSGSMIPTLEIGDQIFVNKFIYGVRVPFLDKVPFVIVREPKRGDVIVFFNRLVGKDFVKRVMAVPGDKVEIDGRKIRVNDHEVLPSVEAEGYHFWDQNPCEDSLLDCIPLWFSNEPGRKLSWREEIGTLKREAVESQSHYIINLPRQDNTERAFTVPPKSVFVMGDDRENSSDSRYGLAGPDSNSVAFVPYDDIKGKATVVWLSLAHGGLFSSIFGGTGIRTDRFFRSVTMCGDEPTRH